MFLNNLKKFKIVSETGFEYSSKNIVDIKNQLKSIFKEKKLILFICDNNEFSLLFYVVNLALKHCLIPISSNTTKISLKRIINNFQPDIIFSKKFLTINEYKVFEKFGTYFLLERKKSSILVHKDLSLLLSTSGTTGDSKFVKLTYENLYSNALAIKKYLNLNSLDSTLTTLPIHYSYGISVINSHLVADAKIHLNTLSFFDKEFWDKIKKKKITNLSGVPFHYEIIHRMGIQKIKLKSLKFCTQAGGKLNTNLVNFFSNEFIKLNKKFYIMYGQTEASPRISYIEEINLIKYPDSVGRAIPGGKIFIKKNKNREGEILYQGKNIFCGYATKRIDLQKIRKIKTLNTGDLGYIKNGLLFITGRIKRIAKIYGIRVNLDTLEDYLGNLGIDCKCVYKNKKIHLFILNDKINKKRIKIFINKDFEININTIEFIKIQNFPLLSNKKINYKLLYEYI
jgi:long-chain acyl-CoA synthetase